MNTIIMLIILLMAGGGLFHSLHLAREEESADFAVAYVVCGCGWAIALLGFLLVKYHS